MQPFFRFPHRKRDEKTSATSKSPLRAAVFFRCFIPASTQGESESPIQAPTLHRPAKVCSCSSLIMRSRLETDNYAHLERSIDVVVFPCRAVHANSLRLTKRDYASNFPSEFCGVNSRNQPFRKSQTTPSHPNQHPQKKRQSPSAFPKDFINQKPGAPRRTLWQSTQLKPPPPTGSSNQPQHPGRFCIHHPPRKPPSPIVVTHSPRRIHPMLQSQPQHILQLAHRHVGDGVAARPNHRPVHVVLMCG